MISRSSALSTSFLWCLLVGFLFNGVSATSNMANDDKIEVTVTFTTIHFEDVIDSGANDHPDVKFKLTIKWGFLNKNSKQTDTVNDKRNGSFDPPLKRSLLVKNTSILDITIKCIETDTILPDDIVDIDPEHEYDRVLNIKYDRSDGTLSGEDDDFKVNGSRDGSTGTRGDNDENDATLEYAIDAPPYSTNEGGFLEEAIFIGVIMSIISLVALYVTTRIMEPPELWNPYATARK